MKQDKLFFILFIAFFSVFVYFMMDFWILYYVTKLQYGRDVSDSLGKSSMGKSLLLLDIYCLLFIVFNYIQNVKRKWIIIVCYIWIVVMVIVNYHAKFSIVTYATTILWPILFLTSYQLCLADTKTFTLLRNYFVVIFVIGTTYFLQFRFLYLDRQTNTIYLSIFILPWILCVNKKYHLLILLLCSLLAFLSMKRSVMLAFLMIWIMYLFFTYKNKSRFVNVWPFVFSLLTLFILYDTINGMMGNALSERVFREETDEGRNRLAIYEVTTAMILESDLTSLLLGHGHYGVYKDSILQISAHNDLLECIYDYGLVIFLFYIYLWFYLFRRCFQLYKSKSSFFFPYAASIALFVCQSMFEHLLLYTSWFNYLVIFWGSIEAMIKRSADIRKKKSVIALYKRIG